MASAPSAEVKTTRFDRLRTQSEVMLHGASLCVKRQLHDAKK